MTPSAAFIVAQCPDERNGLPLLGAVAVGFNPGQSAAVIRAETAET